MGRQAKVFDEHRQQQPAHLLHGVVGQELDVGHQPVLLAVALHKREQRRDLPVLEEKVPRCRVVMCESAFSILESNRIEPNRTEANLKI